MIAHYFFIISNEIQVFEVSTVTWLPIHPTHAIERTRIVIQFQNPLHHKMVSRLGEQFDQVRKEFGFGARIETQAHMVTLVQADATPVVSPKAVGWQFNRTTEQGALMEVVVLDPQNFVYESAEYVRWALFADRLSRMTGSMVAELQRDVDVQSVALEYFDRFVFGGTIDQSVPSGLVRNELLCSLPDSATSGSELWHVHRGWFEGEGPNRFLVNQNIDAQQARNPEGKDVRSVVIYTKVERQAQSGNVDLSTLANDLGAMHDVSKRVIRDALIEDAQKRVGLDQ